MADVFFKVILVYICMYVVDVFFKVIYEVYSLYFIYQICLKLMYCQTRMNVVSGRAGIESGITRPIFSEKSKEQKRNQTQLKIRMKI